MKLVRQKKVMNVCVDGRALTGKPRFDWVDCVKKNFQLKCREYEKCEKVR